MVETLTTAQIDKVSDLVLRDYLKFLATRCQVNAPMDTGKLRSLIKEEIKSITQSKFDANIASNADYSVYVHEKEYTPQKPSSTPEGGVGRKFLSRVVEYYLAKETFEQKFMQEFEKEMVRSDPRLRRV